MPSDLTKGNRLMITSLARSAGWPLQPQKLLTMSFTTTEQICGAMEPSCTHFFVGFLRPGDKKRLLM